MKWERSGVIRNQVYFNQLNLVMPVTGKSESTVRKAVSRLGLSKDTQRYLAYLRIWIGKNFDRRVF